MTEHFPWVRVVEKVKDDIDSRTHGVVANHVEIDGVPWAVPADSAVSVSAGPTELTQVTLTFFASAVHIYQQKEVPSE